MNHSATRRTAGLTAVLLSTTLLLGACGDDKKEASPTSSAASSTTAAPSSSAAPASSAAPGSSAAPSSSAMPSSSAPAGSKDGALCEPYLAVDAQMAGPDGPDPDKLTTLLADVKKAAPSELADDLGVMIAAVEKLMASNGEDSSAIQSPEFVKAESTVDPWIYDNCSFDEKLEVTAKDFHFDGIPATLKAGKTAMLLTNEGVEMHEIGVLRKNEGTTESWEALLALPEEEAMQKATFLGNAFTPLPGSKGLAVLDLEPGDYAALCFIPIGTKVEGGEMTEGTGAPHFTAGMIHEFSVTK